MEFNEKLNMDEAERKRYDKIKKSGKYIELDILIGAEREKFDGHIGKLPVVYSCMSDCGEEEIGNMYLILKDMVDYYKKEYPAECLLAELTMDVGLTGTATSTITRYEEE